MYPGVFGIFDNRMWREQSGAGKRKAESVEIKL